MRPIVAEFRELREKCDRQEHIIKHLVETINILSKQLIKAIDEKKETNDGNRRT